jgi:ABC-type bacteriocin/lantibiotic exporter with double-glycine peptidase domain
MVVNLLFLPALRQKIRNLIIEGTENQGFLVETFRGALVLKTTRATPQAWEEYQRNFGRLAHLRWGTMKLGMYRNTIIGTTSNLTMIGLLWLGSYFVIDGTLSIGQLLAFYGMSLNFLGFLILAVSLTDEFIRLNFHHVGRVELLKDFDLTIPGGKVTALIGPSGCGKSTLVKVLAGLYDLQSGNIRYGIYSQQDLSLECLRQCDLRAHCQGLPDCPG